MTTVGLIFFLKHRMEDVALLSAAQTAALHDICVKHVSGLLTGAGGTGKSFLVRELCQQFESKRRKFALTATTGIAAVLIGGVTLHSFFRIFPDDLRFDESVNIKRVSSNKFFKKELKALQTLIVDEVSMLDCALFDRVHKILCHVHGTGAPFGGIQVVLVGDFFQLPPVSKGKALTFLFESDLFWETCDAMWELKEVWRQADPAFCEMLQRIRVGEPSEEDVGILKDRVDANIAQNSIQPTKLFSKNVNVDMLNARELAKLDAQSAQIFEMREGSHRLQGESANEKMDSMWSLLQSKFRTDVNIPEKLELRVGTQVMLAFNLDTSNGMCNGARGIVVSFAKSKTEGSGRFLEKHFSKQFSDRELALGEGRLAYLHDTLLPVVRFENGKKLLVPFVRWTRKVEMGEVFVWQIPLRLAWATTIHRMQGQTLNLVEISLDSSVFEVGQAYVALSRARMLEGVSLSSFDPTCIKANEKVVEFYIKPFALHKAERLLRAQEGNAVGAGAGGNAKVEVSKMIVVEDD